ncbi:YkvA family protein [Tautonia sociabilis]|uniref:DUF1232 domain-containing protein n=1 Tax=Tautonia sociabilis TaxID=2080755 RepID=A0A432MPU2_9BACT|nr:DUF1232 domain-containing protein [Tautonia sociabilis]
MAERIRRLKLEVIALGLACRDPRVPWYAKLIAGCVVGYALSPIDLIPDFIPVLGYLDDLVVVPLGIVLALRMIPPEVMADCRAHSGSAVADRRPGRVAAGVIVAVWLLLFAAGLSLVLSAARS